MATSKEPLGGGILVVGDWVVDEHWITGDHRSASSSRTGTIHTRALHHPQCSVRSLCGAGQVATILHQARFNPKRVRMIYGVGLWHEDDSDALMAMLDPLNDIGLTPHQVSRVLSPRKYPIHARMINLVAPGTKTEIGTTRVIRVYRQSGDALQLSRRLDWEVPLSKEDWRTIRQGFNAYLKGQLPSPAEISHVVVKDLRKGVVTPELIELLAGVYPNATWYISSKAWSSSWSDDDSLKHQDSNWFDKLPKEQVRLVLIPQLAAAQALAKEHYKISSWITATGEVSRDALDEIQRLGQQRFRHAQIIVLPSDKLGFARGFDEEAAKRQHAKLLDPMGFLWKDSTSGDLRRHLPMASVLFPALIAKLIQEPEIGLSRLLSVGIERLHKWCEVEGQRFLRPDWRPTADQNLSFAIGDDNRLTVPMKREFLWSQAIGEWESAFTTPRAGTPCVVRRVKGKLEFHLWRAMTEIDGYVCCVRSKRKILQHVLDEGRNFGPRDRRRHKSFMLIDSPGSGKSYLIERLAKAIGARLLSFNVTQLLDREDLLHCFDTIITAQAQDPEAIWMVFFDEINAYLDGQHVYDFFLAPLEDGVFVRSGNRFRIEPCFWVFAGTAHPTAGRKDDDIHRASKGSDFESRLTKRPFDLRYTARAGKEGDSMTLERIYVAVAALRATFLDVRQISGKVLQAFKMLPFNVSPRAIQRFVSRFEQIQYGRVTVENLPVDWHNEFDPDGTLELGRQWRKVLKEERDDFVDIRSKPD